MKSEPEIPQKHLETIGDLIDLSDPVPHPPAKDASAKHSLDASVALSKRESQPENQTGPREHDFAKSMPPSKLLNSVPGESSKLNSIQRMDSETHEPEEFHDAHS